MRKTGAQAIGLLAIFYAWTASDAMAVSDDAAPGGARQETALSGVFISPMGDAVIGFGPCDQEEEALCGKVVAQTFAPDVEHDILNPDPELRKTEIIGLTILDGLRLVAENTWKGERFYDPRTGKTYRARIKMLDGERVKIWGCIAAGLCKGYVWTRVDDARAASLFM